MSTVVNDRLSEPAETNSLMAANASPVLKAAAVAVAAPVTAKPEMVKTVRMISSLT